MSTGDTTRPHTQSLFFFASRPVAGSPRGWGYSRAGEVKKEMVAEVIKEVIIIPFGDIIDKTLSESNGDVTKVAELVAKYALETLKAKGLVKDLNESTLRYAEWKAQQKALEYANRMTLRDVIQTILTEFIGNIVRDKYSICTPSERLGMIFGLGITCLAIDRNGNVVYAYRFKEDILIIAKVSHLWKLRMFPKAY